MGVFQRFLGKQDHLLEHKMEDVSNSILRQLHNLKEDSELQRKWIKHLNDFSIKIQDQQQKQKEVTEKSVGNVKSWLEHLQYNQNRQQKDLEKVEESITQMLVLINKSLSDMRERIEDLERAKNNENIKEKKNKTDVANQKPKKKEGIAHFERVEKDKKELVHSSSAQPSLQENYSLTNPENRLLNILLSQNDPLSYSKIAELTGNSINTVRVLMNNLKKKDFVEENILPNGGKLFNVKNREKIRKLYNINPL